MDIMDHLVYLYNDSKNPKDFIEDRKRMSHIFTLNRSRKLVELNGRPVFL